MGRRAVPRVDPHLDLSYHLKAADELPQPWDPAALFDEVQPLEVEVGSGKGLFLRNSAGGTPGHNFLGVEVAHKYARLSAARLAQRDLRNAVIVSCDGLWLFRELLPDDCLAAVHVYFPDPWWKKRHRKRRVLTPEFLANVARTLQSGSEFHFWTDVEEYFTTTLELIAQVPDLVGPSEVTEQPAEHDLDYRTHFERRKRQAGLPIYRSLFAKR